MQLMDEGAAHLDPASEQRVKAAIESMDITRIIVAHRAEAIASAPDRQDCGWADRPR